MAKRGAETDAESAKAARTGSRPGFRYWVGSQPFWVDQGMSRLGTGGFGVVIPATTPDGKPAALKCSYTPPNNPQWFQTVFGIKWGQQVREANLARYLEEQGVTGVVRWLAGPSVRCSTDESVTQAPRGAPREEVVTAYERIHGFDLHKTQQYIGMKTLIRCIIRVAQTLQQMHAVGVIHRDVKPENIMVPWVRRFKPDGSPVDDPVVENAVLIDLGSCCMFSESKDNDEVNERSYGTICSNKTATATPMFAHFLPYVNEHFGDAKDTKIMTRRAADAMEMYSLGLTWYMGLTMHNWDPVNFHLLVTDKIDPDQKQFVEQADVTKFPAMLAQYHEENGGVMDPVTKLNDVLPTLLPPAENHLIQPIQVLLLQILSGWFVKHRPDNPWPAMIDALTEMSTQLTDSDSLPTS